MTRSLQRLGWLLGCLVLLAALRAAPAAAEPDPTGVEYFEKYIRPVLVENCLSCHGPKKQQAGLRLDSRPSLLKGGDGGPVVVPGSPDKSSLIKAVQHQGDSHMPPKGKLSPQAIEALAVWVKLGAPWPDMTGTETAPPNPQRGKNHWAYQPLKKHTPPAGASPIDGFIASRLKEKSLQPVERADRRTLLRRATFDLTGLPPTPEEIDAFLKDDSANAFAKVIDRLLDSPHYGERWGRHWLDVVRYADTCGNAPDFPVPQAYRYRNWVVRAIQQDKPYDRFLREQLAGDLLPAATDEERHEQIVATGYLAIHRRFGLLGDAGPDHQELEDVIDTLGRSVLGLALSCARCHDHKFDPISTKDYYGLYGIFSSTRFPFPGAEGIVKQKNFVPLGPGQDAYAVAEGTPANAKIHKGGDPSKPGAEVPRGFLTILGDQKLAADTPGSGRLLLADWLTGPKNPLAARVMVNRIWLHHFGKGLVQTPNDFSVRGKPPTHPELLDYLAGRFIEGGWSIKAMHRLIMLSDTYQRASTGRPENSRVDPNNDWLWKYPRRRLDAESIRDAMLAVSGDLDRGMPEGHPFPPQSSWNFTQHTPFNAVYDTKWRSVYLMQQRIKKHPFLALFDGADPNASTPDRAPTTTPVQALFWMNDPFVHQQADRLAKRVLSAAPDDDRRLELAYLLVYARPPTADEVQASKEYVQKFAAKLGGVPADQKARQAWASLARVLLGSNEFIYVD